MTRAEASVVRAAMLWFGTAFIAAKKKCVCRNCVAKRLFDKSCARLAAQRKKGKKS